MQPKKMGAGLAGVLMLLLTVWILGVSLFAPFSPRGINLVVVMFSLFVFMMLIGLLVMGRPFGILITEQRVMSLSRLQMTLWTIVILSAFILAALQRVHDSAIDPLAINLDWQLWALLGISTTSLVGTPLILSGKKKKEPADPKIVEDTARAFEPLGETPESVEKNREGILYANEDVTDARLTDIFEGDELKNSPYIDISKVQMFFFTLIAALTYALALYKWFNENDASDLKSFPELSEGLIAILGISHAGYLGSKAVDHTSSR